MNRKKIILLAAFLLILAAAITCWRLSTAPPQITADLPVQPVPEKQSPSETPEEKTRRLLVGTWQDEYKGKRTMTLNADGTATMLVELKGVQAVLMGPKLRFDMKWSLMDQILTKITVSGEPADKVNFILNTMGNTSNETLQEVNEEHLLTLDKDGKTKYDWKRVAKDDTSKP
ncbi:hypothetical protein [Zavarzinella formosa]|uniref:hypothetical protein n=1 Tax=Zavarzinella formosa TaxID=360055 RepID=UPI0002D96B02|nr:hypothetical protein [Zavarzinella formosa]